MHRAENYRYEEGCADSGVLRLGTNVHVRYDDTSAWALIRYLPKVSATDSQWADVVPIAAIY